MGPHLLRPAQIRYVCCEMHHEDIGAYIVDPERLPLGAEKETMCHLHFLSLDFNGINKGVVFNVTAVRWTVQYNTKVSKTSVQQ